jgi:hypothetical protein
MTQFIQVLEYMKRGGKAGKKSKRKDYCKKEETGDFVYQAA